MKKTRWTPLLMAFVLIGSMGLAACDDDGDIGDAAQEIRENATSVADEIQEAATTVADEISEAENSEELQELQEGAEQVGEEIQEGAEAVATAAGNVDVDSALVGNAGHGEELFTSQGCAGCHSTTTDEVVVGPTLKNVADRADDTVPDQDAVEYLRQSITQPDAYVVPGFQPGVMPSFANLSETDINDLVAFLLTLDE